MAPRPPRSGHLATDIQPDSPAGEQILDRWRRVALESGVRLHAESTTRGDRVDVVVEVIR
jgi:hypothetical protein